MAKCLGLKPLKLHRQPKLTEAQKRKRLAFTREQKNWTIQDWWRVLFSDESVFELMHPPNRQNERVWAHSSAEVPAIDTVKQPLKVMVWAMMSHQGLSELHFVPRGQTVTAQYYVEEVLKKSTESAISGRGRRGCQHRSSCSRRCPRRSSSKMVLQLITTPALNGDAGTTSQVFETRVYGWTTALTSRTCGLSCRASST